MANYVTIFYFPNRYLPLKVHFTIIFQSAVKQMLNNISLYDIKICEHKLVDCYKCCIELKREYFEKKKCSNIVRFVFNSIF